MEEKSLIIPMVLQHSSPLLKKVEEQAQKALGWMMCLLLMTLVHILFDIMGAS